jgi:hypothetical protein
MVVQIMIVFCCLLSNILKTHGRNCANTCTAKSCAALLRLVFSANMHHRIQITRHKVKPFAALT